MASTSRERVARHRARKATEEKLVREAEIGAAMVSAQMAVSFPLPVADPEARERAELERAAARRERAIAHARFLASR